MAAGLVDSAESESPFDSDARPVTVTVTARRPGAAACNRGRKAESPGCCGQCRATARKRRPRRPGPARGANRPAAGPPPRRRRGWPGCHGSGLTEAGPGRGTGRPGRPAAARHGPGSTLRLSLAAATLSQVQVCSSHWHRVRAGPGPGPVPVASESGPLA